MFESESFSINPIQFFGVACDCRYLPGSGDIPSFAKYSLPQTGQLAHEETFAKVALGWNEEGIGVHLQVNQSAERSFFPEVGKGDALELFFDTRDLKSAGFNTRFCHHFFFLPQVADGISKGEKTRFRTEDSHPLCDPEALYCETQLRKKDYNMKIFIPAQCLYGYDPKQFDRLGFTYRVDRFGGDPQHFAVVSQDYQIDQQPSLWGSIQLVKNE